MPSTQLSRPGRARGHIRRIAPSFRRDQFTARGAQIVKRLRQAVRQGNVLRIRVRDRNGQTLVEIPLVLGVRGGARLAPVWAVVGALASVSGELTVQLERENAWPVLEAPRVRASPDGAEGHVTEWDPRLS
jgi:uncharacterized protein DUF4342